MDIDQLLPNPPTLASMSVALESDGLLLYVSQASYEPGTSPLSNWIPITGYIEGRDGTGSSIRPLDLFEQFVTHRLLISKTNSSLHLASVDMEV